MHGLCGMDSHNNKVEEVPVLRVRVSTGDLLFITLSEDGVLDDKTTLCTFSQGMDAIGDGFPYSFLLIGAAPEFQVMYNSGAEVTKENDIVLLASIN